MKTINNISLTTKQGEVIKDQSGTDLNAVELIKVVLDNCKYKDRSQQRQGNKVYDKLEKVKGKAFDLEDAEFDLVYTIALDYDPFLNGRTFNPFLEELERAKGE